MEMNPRSARVRGNLLPPQPGSGNSGLAVTLSARETPARLHAGPSFVNLAANEALIQFKRAKRAGVPRAAGNSKMCPGREARWPCLIWIWVYGRRSSQRDQPPCLGHAEAPDRHAHPCRHQTTPSATAMASFPVPPEDRTISPPKNRSSAQVQVFSAHKASAMHTSRSLRRQDVQQVPHFHQKPFVEPPCLLELLRTKTRRLPG